MTKNLPPSLSFSNPTIVARYAEGPVRQIPGFDGLQKMTAILLAERIQSDARVLVLGAGGGLELKALAEANPSWNFCGVDPSPEMLGLAKSTLGPLAARVEFHEGYIDQAPIGPFDAATCLLTFHFISEQDRRRVLAEVHQRLRPGAPFVVAHHSFPQDAKSKSLWLSRYAAFAVASGFPATKMESSIAAIGERLPVLSPERDEQLLTEAGFADVSLFYAGFTFRGWVAYKA